MKRMLLLTISGKCCMQLFVSTLQTQTETVVCCIQHSWNNRYCGRFWQGLESPKKCFDFFLCTNGESCFEISFNAFARKRELCCDVVVLVPSQMIVSKTLSRRDMIMSVATKIILQMNCKMGGELWAVPIPVAFSVVYFHLVELSCQIFQYPSENNALRMIGSWKCIEADELRARILGGQITVLSYWETGRASGL